MPTVALVGGGPSALVTAIAFARRGIATSVFERESDPEEAPRFDPDRSYTIDISGHGLRALRHVDACESFDARMFPFKGLKFPDGRVEPWNLPGWTGSRGDILRALMAVVETSYSDRISAQFQCRVTSVDVNTGTLTFQRNDGVARTAQFDFIVGADGAGSVVRQAMATQLPGFAVDTGTFPNYCAMIELDGVDPGMDPHFLHGLSVRPFCVAGAIKPDAGSNTPRWFGAVGTKTQQTFTSPVEVRGYFQRRVPRILELTSGEKIAAFADRPCYHIGRTLRCSQLYGGKAVLLGDAAAAFPPIGQGVNAAMESAMVLDLCIGETGSSASDMLEAARLYDARWRPEADAVSWLSVRSLFENRYHMFRASIASRLGLSVFDQAKSATVRYSEVRRKAESLWPLWA